MPRINAFATENARIEKYVGHGQTLVQTSLEALV